jgi:hypothetical protein
MRKRPLVLTGLLAFAYLVATAAVIAQPKPAAPTATVYQSPT